MDAPAAGNEGGQSRPLVSVVTATWNRFDRLTGAISNLGKQDYGDEIEHIIVSDGPDPHLKEYLRGLGVASAAPRYPIRFVELGFNTTSLIPESHAIGPTLTGALMARGDFITYLPDDDRMEPDHIRLLVDLLEETGCDFAYPQAHHVRNGHTTIIGQRRMEYGQVPCFLHRRELLAKARWQFGDGVANDWMLIRRWIAAGARPAFLKKVTFTHHADH